MGYLPSMGLRRVGHDRRNLAAAEAAGQDLNTGTRNDRSPCRVKDSAHKCLQWLGHPLSCSTLDSPPQVQALELSPNSRQSDQFRETLAPRSAPVWSKYPGRLC